MVTDGQETGENEKTLTSLIDTLIELSQSGSTVGVHRIREALGERSFGPFLLVPAIIEVSPIGSIPGLPTIIAMIVALFSFQVLLNRKHLWLPDFIERQQVSSARLYKILGRLKSPAKYVDIVLKARLRWVTKPPLLQVIAFSAICLATMVPALEFIPFASTLPMASVALFGAALLCRDGLVALIGLMTTLGTLIFLGSFLI
ncbi:exopolysaccharide biosynthesis protein [Agrobacterium sp.]|uniref:exopolysaccharide biosynthesis protein n=1 Tax=Agrobacterium sp. TaxID=361 RepID=UPI0028A94DC0|nr:exopolysaccharide biosynthesis protein [Agrobacterium sp.]